MPSTSSARTSVHPRVCGEHERDNDGTADSVGSSPRVRGTHHQRPGATFPRRFIPACAGNTFSAMGYPFRLTVHPRVCGEHCSSAEAIPTCGGSSPRVRGTPGRASHIGRANRFIPACAGNTARPAASSQGHAVHPRVCGEHSVLIIRSHIPGGSSPRVRGTPRCSHMLAQTPRFIPACAGNTRTTRMRRSSITVHPRVCGEHARMSGSQVFHSGSSPRVRGTRGRLRWRSAGSRFIPACAGNTNERSPTRSG